MIKFSTFAVLALLTTSAAYGSMISVSVSAAGVQTANSAALCAGSSLCVAGVEDFSTFTGGTYNSNFTSTGSYSQVGSTPGAIAGQYSGGAQKYMADQYGGAGGTGAYTELFASGGVETLLFTTSGSVPGVNYFGLWFSALDGANVLTFYSNNNVVSTFNATSFQNLVGACTNSNPYCGNPNAQFSNKDNGEQYAFLNFTATGGFIDKITFSESGGGGFESDNHTVGYRSAAAPEPGTIGMAVMSGALLIGFLARQRRRRV